MLLFKCKCNCFFTRDSSALSQRNIRCPNCAQTVELPAHCELPELSKCLADAGISVKAIPDDAKITVTFDV